MTHTRSWNRTLVGGIAAIACCVALAACSVGDEAVDEDVEVSEDEAYCGPEPHFVWTGSECLPSCGAAGGNYCGGWGTICWSHGGGIDAPLRSWDCTVCCPDNVF